MTTRIDFYYDPSCPFCWITSRWLIKVGEQRDMDVTWRPFSLALKNNELAADGSDESPHGELHRAGHRIHRVIQAAAQGGASQLDLYSAFGRKFHVGKQDYDDALIAQVLQEENLPADLAQAADDTSYDAHLSEELQSALDVVGNDVGVPLIVFHSGDKPLGYFGPVLNEMPGDDEALSLWDGLEKMATVTAFYELKRSRPQGGPDTQSTQGL